ncbi:MAG: carbohydrate ABC transporter permease [Bacillota bacterium]
MKKKILQLINLKYKTQKKVYGLLFVSPFLLGFIFLFLVPFVQSAYYSLSEIEITSSGYEVHYLGLDNYMFAFFENASFVPNLLVEIRNIVAELPMIIIFSFLAAAVLNQKFRGRFFARAIFFLPVILGAGVVLSLQQGDFAMEMAMESTMGSTGESAQAAEEAGMFSASGFENFMMNFRLPEFFTTYVIQAVNEIPDIINASAIQILIFLAGLQGIPSSLYESAKVEGASGWEKFWLITFPLLSPVILINIVYTVIDQFVGEKSSMLEFINSFIFDASYTRGTAMAFIFFMVIAVFLLIVGSVVSRFVFYQD